MKTFGLPVVAASLLTAAIVFCAPQDARAGIGDALGSWEGTGSGHDVSGKDLGAFTVAITRKAGAARGSVRSDGKVTLASGQEIVFWQEMEDHGASGFRLVTNNGSGGGRCFANRMCQWYEKRADGHAFATTVVCDSDDKMRILVTELDRGQAVRFFEQTLTKKP